MNHSYTYVQHVISHTSSIHGREDKLTQVYVCTHFKNVTNLSPCHTIFINSGCGNYKNVAKEGLGFI